MSLLNTFISLILHLDKYLDSIVQNYGSWIYIVLFAVIFAETGLVIMPFLPGDSLIFVAGTLAAKTAALNIFLLFFLLAAAAILGDTINYWIGKYLGRKIEKSRWIRQEYIERTNQFYKKHGGKTIILARFIPVIRTFAPFVAGLGKMEYIRFLSFNVIGGITWVALFVFGGYYFGTIPWVEKNLTLVILAIIILSFIPAMIELLRHKKRSPES